MWDEITYPFPDFNGATVKVREWTGIILSRTWLGMWLLIHAAIRESPHPTA